MLAQNDFENLPSSMNMYVTQIQFGTPAYDETVRLRTDILRKPLQLEYSLEQLAAEWSDMHLACYTQFDELVGCMIFTQVDDKTLKMRQVAVASEWQGRGVGTFLMAECEKFARVHGYTRIEMHARDVAVPFYLKLGYRKVGKQFTEVTIPHFKMEKTLETKHG
jgi:predicted GNAT family N-acyltransferase